MMLHEELPAAPSPPGVWDVFTIAMLLADQEGALEITVDHLLTALNRATSHKWQVDQPRSAGIHLPVPHRDQPFSREVIAVLDAASKSSIWDFDTLSMDALRDACWNRRRSTERSVANTDGRSSSDRATFRPALMDVQAGHSFYCRAEIRARIRLR